ncbi:hypothetical protein [Kribbella karoonensis]|uniref:Uncharacterized protein n=1 Tax=Kribbella karoonensis TaxID=324851 RepID=A0ABN2EHC0_9ACTN
MGSGLVVEYDVSRLDNSPQYSALRRAGTTNLTVSPNSRIALNRLDTSRTLVGSSLVVGYDVPRLDNSPQYTGLRLAGTTSRIASPNSRIATNRLDVSRIALNQLAVSRALVGRRPVNGRYAAPRLDHCPQYSGLRLVGMTSLIPRSDCRIVLNRLDIGGRVRALNSRGRIVGQVSARDSRSGLVGGRGGVR